MTTLHPPPPPDVLVERYESVVRRIARERYVRKSTAARWLHETMKFLDLCAASPEQLSPSRKVDCAWHEFILHTRDYEEWCRGRYGEYIHHTPMDGVDHAAYKRTLDLLESTYGTRDRKIWPRRKDASGGSCGGGCGASWGGESGGGGSSCGGGGCGGGSG